MCAYRKSNMSSGENVVYVCINSDYCMHGELDVSKTSIKIDTVKLDRLLLTC